MFQALWADGGYYLRDPNLQIGVQIYKNHIQSVLVKKDNDGKRLEVIEVLSGYKQPDGIEAPIFYPSYLLVGYLRGTGNDPKIVPDPNLLIAKPEGMEKLAPPPINAGYVFEEFAVQSPYAFSEGRGQYSSMANGSGTGDPVRQSRPPEMFTEFGETMRPKNSGNTGSMGGGGGAKFSDQNPSDDYFVEYRGVDPYAAELEKELGYGPFIYSVRDVSNLDYQYSSKEMIAFSSYFQANGEREGIYSSSPLPLSKDDLKQQVKKSKVRKSFALLAHKFQADIRWKDLEVIKTDPALFLSWDPNKRKDFLIYLKSLTFFLSAARNYVQTSRDAVYRPGKFNREEFHDFIEIGDFIRSIYLDSSKASFLSPVDTLMWFNSLSIDEKLEFAEYDHLLSFFPFHFQKNPGYTLPLGRVFVQGTFFEALKIGKKNIVPSQNTDNEKVERYLKDSINKLIEKAEYKRSLTEKNKDQEMIGEEVIEASEVTWLVASPKPKKDKQKSVGTGKSNDGKVRTGEPIIKIEDINLSSETKLLLLYLFRSGGAPSVYDSAFHFAFDKDTKEPISIEFIDAGTQEIAYGQLIPYIESEYRRILVPFVRRIGATPMSSLDKEHLNEFSPKHPFSVLNLYFGYSKMKWDENLGTMRLAKPSKGGLNSFYPNSHPFDFEKAFRSGELNLQHLGGITEWMIFDSHYKKEKGLPSKMFMVPEAIFNEYQNFEQKYKRSGSGSIELNLLEK